MNNKYEQLVEFIINDETNKARELFHQIVVEKSRDIYESLVDDEDLGEALGGNEIEDLVDEVSLDEEGIAEDEDEFGSEEQGDEFGGEESDLDSADGEEFSGDEFDADAEEASVEDRVVDLETALDELKAEFDALMGQEEAEGHDLGGDEFGGEEFGSEEQGDDFGGDEELVREYVEKVTLPSNKSEGGEVGKGGSANINKQSTVAKPNNMGGTAGNFAKGTPNKNPTGPSSTQKPKGDLVSNPQNKPGANAGKSAFKTKQAPKAGEGQTTDGKVPVSAKSPYAK